MLVGNFDGLHRGHQALFAAARRIADQRDARVVAVTFTQHPVAVLRPETEMQVISHRAQRAELLTDAGAEEIDWLEPTPGLLGLSPEQFIRQMVDRHHPVAMVEGPNFRFGRKRAGDVETLGAIGRQLDFDVHVEPMVRVTLRDKLQARVSSSLIRWLLSCGRVADAAIALGRPWTLRGEVIEGDARGRTLGIRTANLDTTPQMLPADGVYAGDLEIDGDRHLAAVSVGVKPTFAGSRRTCEVHVLDYAGDLYGRSLAVRMHRWLRDQRRFPDAAGLVAQIEYDVRTLRQYDATDLLAPADLAAAS